MNDTYFQLYVAAARYMRELRRAGRAYDDTYGHLHAGRAHLWALANGWLSRRA